jgi:hypothetical protein
MITRKRVNTSPSEDLTSPSKKANQKFTSSYDAITMKSVSPQNSLRGLIGDPMVEPRLRMVNQSSAQLSWRDGKLERTQAAVTGVVKSQDMVIDAEVWAFHPTILISRPLQSLQSCRLGAGLNYLFFALRPTSPLKSLCMRSAITFEIVRCIK